MGEIIAYNGLNVFELKVGIVGESSVKVHPQIKGQADAILVLSLSFLNKDHDSYTEIIS